MIRAAEVTMSNRLRVAACALLLTASSFAGTIIHVPANQPTIQAGINAASNGDIVLVAPGTYTENINFNGKAITLKSSNGAKVTIVDGGQNGPVVTFNSGETTTAVLQGFTITNGRAAAASSYSGGGIYINNASPTIAYNIITNNIAPVGGGIEVNGGSPIITNNSIKNNIHDSAFSGGRGGGISLDAGASGLISGNIVSGHTWPLGSGGGISLYQAGSPLLMNNTITSNSLGPTGQAGGGVFVVYGSPTFVQNLITNNYSPTLGGGIYAYPSTNTTTMLFVNNTIANNVVDIHTANPADGSAVYLVGTDSKAKFFNNVLTGATGRETVFCASSVFKDNDVFSSSGSPFTGTCTSWVGTNGNISVDPLFLNSARRNYRLNGGSPAIDKGYNAAPSLPTADLAGNPRIINGNDLATAKVDMGAYEFVPVVLAPKSLGFGLQAVGSSISKTVKLTNAQNTLLNVSSYTVPTDYSVSGCGSSIAAFTSCTLTVTFHPLTSGTFKGSLVVKDDAGNSPQTVPLSGSAH